MTISWLGFSCFKIQTKELIIITDPYSAQTGLKAVKGKADIVTVSHDHYDHNYTSGIMGDPFIITEPGEYEVKGIYVVGYPAFHDNKEGEERGKNIIFRFTIEGMTIAHLGDLGHMLSEEQVDALGDIDILLVSAGSKHALVADKIPELVSQIEPRMVIPMHYAVEGVKADLVSIDLFRKEMGVASTDALPKLKISKKDMASEETEIKILQKQ